MVLSPFGAFSKGIQEEINYVKVKTDFSMTTINFSKDLTSEGHDSVFEAAGVLVPCRKSAQFFTSASFYGCFKMPVWEITQSTVQPSFQETFLSWMMEYSHLLSLGCVHTAKSISTREWCLAPRPNHTSFYIHSHCSIDGVHVSG